MQAAHIRTPMRKQEYHDDLFQQVQTGDACCKQEQPTREMVGEKKEKDQKAPL